MFSVDKRVALAVPGQGRRNAASIAVTPNLAEDGQRYTWKKPADRKDWEAISTPSGYPLKVARSREGYR
jgi:hypothetical protein